MKRQFDNDPRLTAYALGELVGDDAAAVEAMLAGSEDARAEVEAIREAALSIRGALGATGAAGLALSESGRTAILESAAAAPARIIRHPLRRWGTTLTAAAASLALVATLWRAPSGTRVAVEFADYFATNQFGERMIVPADPEIPMLWEWYVAPQPDGSVPYLIHGKNQTLPRPLLPDLVPVAVGVKPADASRRAVDKASSGSRPALEADSFGGGGGCYMGLVANSTAVPHGADSASFGRDITHFTFDLQGSTDGVDWTGSEVAVDAVGTGSIWHASDQRAAPAAAGKNRFDFRGDPHLSYGYETPDGSRGRPMQKLDALAIGRQAQGVDQHFSTPSSDDSDADRRYLLGDIPLLRVLSDGSISITGSPKQIEAIQDALVVLEQNAEGDAAANSPGSVLPLFVGTYEQILRQNNAEALDRFIVEMERLHPNNMRVWEALDELLAEDRASRDNPFLESLCRPLSTFSIDVDTAAYSLVRQALAAGQLPQPESVRIEELINYFDYDYPPPSDDRPFAANLEIAACPWQPAHRLVRVGLKGQVVQAEQRPIANLVFLIDVSGSMNEPAKLPMVKNSLRMLVDQLWDDDRVALVVYAGAAGLVLPSTPASQRDTILAAIDNLSAGGSTDGGSGIALAYDVAAQNFLAEGINRVVLATDGDFNVGISDRGQLETLIADRAKTGVFLTTLGFGYGNVNDKTLETLADKGNGNYAIIDSLDEAKHVLVDQVGATLQTIAKDVKIQVEFNPATVAGYRLIGYENRMLAARDFNDDTKDAGEIGAGHTVTALYEIVPAGLEVPPMTEAALAKLPPEDSLRSVLSDEGVDPLKYQTPGEWMRAILPPVEADSHADISTRTPSAEDTDPNTVTLQPSAGNRQEHTTAYSDSERVDDSENAASAIPMPEIMTLKLRYKRPDGDVSSKIEFAVADNDAPFVAASDDFRFAAAVAAYGLILRDSIYSGEINMAGVAEIAAGALGIDESGRRSEFVELAKRAGELLASRTAN